MGDLVSFCDLAHDLFSAEYADLPAKIRKNRQVAQRQDCSLGHYTAYLNDVDSVDLINVLMFLESILSNNLSLSRRLRINVHTCG